MSDTTRPPEPRLDPLAIGRYARLQDMTGARNDLWRENVKLRAELEAARECLRELWDDGSIEPTLTDEFCAQIRKALGQQHSAPQGGESEHATIERAALRKVRDTLRRADLGPGTTIRIIGEIVDQALAHDPKEPTT